MGILEHPAMIDTQVVVEWNEPRQEWLIKRAKNGAFLMNLPDCENTRKIFGIENKETVKGTFWFQEDKS